MVLNVLHFITPKSADRKLKYLNTNQLYDVKHVCRLREERRSGSLKHFLPVGFVFNVLSPVAHSFRWLQSSENI